MPSIVRTLALIDESSDIPAAEMVVSQYGRDIATPRVIDEVTVELARRHKREASVVLSYTVHYTMWSINIFHEAHELMM